MSELPIEAVAERFAAARERIAAAGGDPERVRVIAMTKTFGPWAAAAALAVGLTDLGVNRAQELVATDRALKHRDEPSGEEPWTWHFLGPVQRNKVASLAPLVDLWQAVDRIEVGEAIAGRAPGARVLVQVRVVDDPNRPGCPPAETAALVDALRGHGLSVEGLMAVAPIGLEPARAAFRTVAAMARDLGLEELSMGMTEDLEVAVEEGSTMVRLGRALFGPRPGAGEVRR